MIFVSMLTRFGLLCTVAVGLGSAMLPAAPDRQGATPAPQQRQRTEAEAREIARRNRENRVKQRHEKGGPVELVPSYIRAAILPVPESLGVSPFYKK
jgi:hypothetical protein